MNKARLQQLERDLRAFPQKNVDQFSMKRWFSGAVAWFCRQHPTWTLKMAVYATYNYAGDTQQWAVPHFGEHTGLVALQEYFGLTLQETDRLFSPDQYADWPEGQTGPREVANRIKCLLMGDVEDNDDADANADV